MPSAGLQIFGAGLRLQPVTPGTNDQGNAHISGTFIAETGLSGCAGWVVGGARQRMAFVGEGITFPGGLTTTGALGSSGVGWNMQVGIAGDANSALETVTMGYAATSWRRGNTVIGASAQSTGSNTAGGYNVVIGRSATCQDASNGASSGGNVQIGANCTGSDSARAVVIGMACTYSGKSNNAGVKNAVLIGSGIKSPSGVNQIVISSSYDGTVGSQLTETRNNVIKIGDATHAILEIAGKDLTSFALASAATVNDANLVATSIVNAALYATLTAARTVTLPAANSVPAGWIFRTVDFSGAASGVNTITTNPAGADTIVGPGSPVINSAYGAKRFMSDGVSKWNIENNW